MLILAFFYSFILCIKRRSEPEAFQRYYRTAATKRAPKNEERFIQPGKRGNPGGGSFDRTSATYFWQGRSLTRLRPI